MAWSDAARQAAAETRASNKKMNDPRLGSRIKSTQTSHYGDNGTTVHSVNWANGSMTSSGVMGTHMQALFDRARREGAPHQTYGSPANSVAAQHGIGTEHLHTSNPFGPLGK
jgi:hypothetical protein